MNEQEKKISEVIIFLSRNFPRNFSAKTFHGNDIAQKMPYKYNPAIT